MPKRQCFDINLYWPRLKGLYCQLFKYTIDTYTIGNTDHVRAVLRVQQPFRYGVVFESCFRILQCLNFKILCVALLPIRTSFALLDGNSDGTVCLWVIIIVTIFCIEKYTLIHLFFHMLLFFFLFQLANVYVFCTRLSTIFESSIIFNFYFYNANAHAIKWTLYIR